MVIKIEDSYINFNVAIFLLFISLNIIKFPTFFDKTLDKSEKKV